MMLIFYAIFLLLSCNIARAMDNGLDFTMHHNVGALSDVFPWDSSQRVFNTPKPFKTAPPVQPKPSVKQELSRPETHRPSGKKSFACSQCGKTFTRSSNCYRHEKEHLGQQYSCLGCSKKYMQKSGLNYHLQKFPDHKNKKCQDKEQNLLPGSSRDSFDQSLSPKKRPPSSHIENGQNKLAKTITFAAQNPSAKSEQLPGAESCPLILQEPIAPLPQQALLDLLALAFVMHAPQTGNLPLPESASDSLVPTATQAPAEPATVLAQPIVIEPLHEEAAKQPLTSAQLTCSECGKSFAKIVYLKKHIKIHTGKKPFSCTFPGCGKSFLRKDALRPHMRVHTGEKPYACSQCRRSFKTNHSKSNHEKTVCLFNIKNEEEQNLLPSLPSNP